MSFDWSEHMGNEGSDYPAAWKPENEGDKVEGTVVRIENVTVDGKTKPVMELSSDDVDVTVWVSQVKLRQLVAAQNPQVGDRVRIEFTGTEKLESGRTMKLFDVDVTKVPDDERPF